MNTPDTTRVSLSPSQYLLYVLVAEGGMKPEDAIAQLLKGGDITAEEAADLRKQVAP